MFKKQHLALAIAATLAAANAQAFNAESFTVSGYVKNETAALTKDGQFNGQETGPTDTTNYNDSGDLIKSETSVKLYVNGDVGEGSSMHAELLLHNDSKAKGSHFKNSDSYTQSEFLRELYVDTTAGDWDVRLGKQQVVWGTADGAKFMDMINPTDYREMAQNVMAESRIPVWMISAEKYLDNGANIQFIASQPRENIFAGLNRDISTTERSNGTVSSFNYTGDVNATGHDEGNAFILKGVDSITGGTNGFLNIVPDLGTVSTMFGMAFAGTAGATLNTAAGLAPDYHPAMNYFTVGSFNNSGVTLAGFSAMYNGMVDTDGLEDGALTGTGLELTGTTADGFGTLVFGTTAFWAASGVYSGQDTLGAFAAMFNTNLLTTDSALNSTFEYMDRTAFSTFDAFVGAKSQYVYNMPDDTDMDLAFRFKNSTSNGVNYSLAYAYQYDKNPIINLRWKNSAGQTLTVTETSHTAATDLQAGQDSYAHLTLTDGTNRYGGYGMVNDGTSAAILEFEQTVERAHNIGAALDFGLDTEAMGPVVIRGEFVYQKDGKQPVIDRGYMSIGHLPKALTMRDADKFKYVIGADVTALTDMMVSAQFIQERNLDFIDNKVDWDGTACSSVNSANCGVYTTDYASMHLTNGFNKAIENKEFYSLFLSKPFGASGEGRWNNILMLEEGGGRWNRFDVEYSLSNDLIGSIEYNKYWGDDNSQFGQLEAASNIQVGLKYLFE